MVGSLAAVCALVFGKGTDNVLHELLRIGSNGGLCDAEDLNTEITQIGSVFMCCVCIAKESAV